jgi:hypothetical protein
MKFQSYLIENKIKKAKEILTLLDRDTKLDPKKHYTKSDLGRQRQSRIGYHHKLKMLNLSSKEIDELAKWQKKQGFSK